MTERHLREANPETAQADLVAAEILAEFGTPESYERAHALIAIAYLRGGQDTLRWAGEKIGGAA